MPNIDDINVSRETEEKLKAYLALLNKWQPKINLVSPQTLNNAWNRHFIDSAQLSPLLSDHHKIIFDFGSGAGFPALVLAMMHNDKSFTVVESDQKKCSFMKTVSRETAVENTTVLNKRIEDVSRETIPDLIMARALASLDKLLDYSRDWIKMNSNLQLLFPKGENYEAELIEAQNSWDFDVETHQSKTENGAHILLLSNISYK